MIIRSSSNRHGTDIHKNHICRTSDAANRSRKSTNATLINNKRFRFLPTHTAYTTEHDTRDALRTKAKILLTAVAAMAGDGGDGIVANVFFFFGHGQTEEMERQR